jgi:hypothetical protein
MPATQDQDKALESEAYRHQPEAQVLNLCAVCVWRSLPCKVHASVATSVRTPQGFHIKAQGRAVFVALTWVTP